jgi:hypothetical protein
MNESEKSPIRFSKTDRMILSNIVKGLAKLDEAVRILSEKIEKLPPNDT